MDMTPMVDLAFLLLTFFILTTTMYKPSTLQISFPVPPEENQPPPDPTKLDNAITLILTTKDQIFYYLGAFRAVGDPKGPPTELTRTDFSKVREVLVEKNKDAIVRLNKAATDFNEKKITEAQFDSLRKVIKGGEKNLKAIIKTDRDAKYRNMIDMVDEMDISGIGSYGVLDSLKVEEQVLLDAQKANL